MSTLIVIPTLKETEQFLGACSTYEVACRNSSLGRLPVVELPEQDVVLATGGLGKVQFALLMQYLLLTRSRWDLAICLGAAGALDPSLTIGDIVVATTTMEHDFRNGFGPRRLPTFPAAPEALNRLQAFTDSSSAFQVHFGPVASGDEDIVDAKRREALRNQTGAMAVAWEGAGGARACQFNETPFLEIRAISDVADENAPTSFERHLHAAMANAAQLITEWLAVR